MNEQKLETLRQSIATYLRSAPVYNKLFRLDGLMDGLTRLQKLLACIMSSEPLTLDRNRRREMVEEGAEVLAYQLPLGTAASYALAIMRNSIERMPTEPEGSQYWLSMAENQYEYTSTVRIKSAWDMAIALGEMRRSLYRDADGNTWRMVHDGLCPSQMPSEPVERWTTQLYMVGGDNGAMLDVNVPTDSKTLMNGRFTRIDEP